MEGKLKLGIPKEWLGSNILEFKWLGLLLPTTNKQSQPKPCVYVFVKKASVVLHAILI